MKIGKRKHRQSNIILSLIRHSERGIVKAIFHETRNFHKISQAN